MFINYGGPGGTAVDTTQAVGKDLFGAVNDKFDLVAFDPRGVGQSTPSIDCKANQETQGIYSKPFTTPENLDVGALLGKDKAYIQRCISLNREILPYLSTANVARDMDGIRAAMGDAKLNYFGFSYGTFLGATYASLFPDNYRSMVLDGPVDANSYINNPSAGLREQSAGFEVELGRFFQACAAFSRSASSAEPTRGRRSTARERREHRADPGARDELGSEAARRRRRQRGSRDRDVQQG